MLKIGLAEKIILEPLSCFAISNNLYNAILTHPRPLYDDGTTTIIRHLISNDEFLLNALKEYKNDYKYIVFKNTFNGCIFAKDIIGYVDDNLIENYYE